MSSGPFDYSVYGLAVTSDLPLAGLRPPTGQGAPLRIRAEQASDFPVPPGPARYGTDIERHWHLEGGDTLSCYGIGGAYQPWSMRASAGGDRLDIRWSQPDQLEDIAVILQGAGLAMALHQQGAFILHASAIQVGGKAILMIGHSGAGKSTTAAALVRAGCPMISDDMAVLDQNEMTMRVRAGPGRMRVYPDSARAAGWTQPLGRLLRHAIFDDKGYIDLDPALQGPETAVAAIYVLEPRVADVTETAITPIPPRTALGPLLQNIYRSEFLGTARTRAAALQCAWIAQHIPVLAVRRPDRLAALSEVAGAIVEHSRALP